MIQHKKTGYLIRQKSVRDIQKALIYSFSHINERNMIGKNARIKIKNQFDWINISSFFYSHILSQ